MKYFYMFLICALMFSSAPSIGMQTNASCQGTKNCGEGQWVSCEISIPSLGHCRIDHLPNGVKCTALNANWEETGTKTKLCIDDGGSGAICDPSDPFYWVYCDPFAL